MTKRRLANDLDEVREAVLGDLSPDERLQLFLDAEARGSDEWLDRLVETCPRSYYRCPDRAFVERARLALLFAHHAVYELHTTYLHYELVGTHQRFMSVLALTRGEGLSEAVRDQAADRADQRQALFAELYTAYHAYRQFAEATLGVDLDAVVAFHPEGPAVLAAVEDSLDDPLAVELAEDWVADEADDREAQAAADGDGTPSDEVAGVTLDELAAIRADGLQEFWAEVVAELDK